MLGRGSKGSKGEGERGARVGQMQHHHPMTWQRKGEEAALQVPHLQCKGGSGGNSVGARRRGARGEVGRKGGGGG